MNSTIRLLALFVLVGCRGSEPSTSAASQAVRATPRATERGATPATAPATAAVLQPIVPEKLCMTTGTVARAADGRLSVTGPKTRGVVAGSDGNSAEMRFTYLGETAETAPLASGQIRLQLGLKLRAADGCNVTYVMFRISPKPGLQIQTKRNDGMRTHEECQTNGYNEVAFVAPIEEIENLAVGSKHTIRAEILDGVLVASIDGLEKWRGPIDTGPVVGPVGFRSDNVAFDFDFDAVDTGVAADCTTVIDN